MVAQSSPQITARHSYREACDANIMRRWAKSRCGGNNYTEWHTIIDNCNATCETTTPDEKSKNQKCCEWKCGINSILVDGKINKTAMESLYGTAGDPKTVENIDNCEAIGKCRVNHKVTNFMKAYLQLRRIQRRKCTVTFR